MQGYEGSQVMAVHGAFKSERTLRTPLPALERSRISVFLDAMV